MSHKIKDVYEPQTDGRTYTLSLTSNNNHFVNFDERELIETIEILIQRKKKTAIKIIALIDEVGKKLKKNNLFLESIKTKCLGKQ